MTGRYPSRFGCHATAPTNLPVFPDGYTTLAGMLRGAGYATGLFGKWHLGSDPEFFPGKFGFDYSYGSLAGGVDPYTHRYKVGPFSKTWHRSGDLLDEQGHATDLIAREAAQWISMQASPWFCYVPFTAVHTPIRAPEEWIDRYSSEVFDSDPERDRSFKTYAAYTSHMDHAVGRLIETLKRIDQIHNTIVVFTSDNGAPTGNCDKDTARYPGHHESMPRAGSNHPLRGQKTELYEGGIRTPAVIQWAGHLRPGKFLQSVHMVDWMPTFAAMLGCADFGVPRWDGENIWPFLVGEDARDSGRMLYWNLKDTLFAVKREGWKLILHEHNGRRQIELFHVEIDPLEQREISAEHSSIVESLLAEIHDQRSRDNCSVRPDILDGKRFGQPADITE